MVFLGMATVVMVGGGIAALTTAMLLADDGHVVTVLERDPAGPTDPQAAWERWERRGVSQFRLPHLFVSRFRVELERELPRVVKALDEAGAHRLNVLALAPPKLAGEPRAGDGEYEMLTGRRPVVESVVARMAESTPGITLRRGEPVVGLVADEAYFAGGGTVPRVTGVRTAGGDRIAGDLVVDATGRRSALARWLHACGAAPPDEEVEDSGFVYYARHFASSDGSMPVSKGPGLQEHGTVSSLTMPADNGTWAVVIVASAADRALRGLHNIRRWSEVVRSLPLVSHWIDAEPLNPRVVKMSGIEDRHRCLVVGGEPVATGVVPLADAWSCTNPSLGRGVSLGVVHGGVLRDTLRRSDPAQPRQFALDFHEATTTSVEPWYRATVRYDRHRLAEIDAHIRGRTYEPGDTEWEGVRRIQLAAGRDPDCLRASLAMINVIRTPDEVLAQPGILGKAEAAGSGLRDRPLPGPTRSELVAIAGA
jgi:2-polyprenyl-6-methoxyphenol hydroxylase-like FAD-dependent oxidoreductase